MESKGIWSEEKEREEQSRIKKEVLKAFNEAEREKRPELRAMFEDVYETVTEEQEEQISKLKDILERYPGEYDVESYDRGKSGLDKKS